MAARNWLRKSALLIGGMSFLLASCDLAPTYHPPHLIYPNGWSGQGIMRDAQPADMVQRGRWWEVLQDPLLNQLETKLLSSNPDLQAAAEAFTQERDIARETESQLYPQISGSGRMSRNKSSRRRLYLSRNSTSPIYESNVMYSGAATWEPDFWDSIRNSTRMQKNMAQASAAEYALTRLSLEAELASHYVALRGLDAQLAVYADSIRYFQDAVEITRLRQGGAIGDGLDVSRAENQLYAAQAGQSRLLAQRQVEEHAIAALLNTVPAGFHIEPINDVRMHFATVQIKTGLPSTLLERRPDIAMSERQMAAAARSIGVSRAAFYPHITFSATGGFEDSGFDLASISRAFWTVAVQAVEPLFTGGMRRAALQRAWSQYRERVDDYRSVVLGAFQDVEDGISQTRLFHQEQLQQKRAVEAALRTQSMTMSLYTGGLTNYLDALVAQQDALRARLLEVQAQMSQIQATVRLVRALGGGWDSSVLPKVNEIDPFGPFQYDNLHHARAAGEVPVKGQGKENGLEPSKEDSDLTGHDIGHP
ncbi:efflux transporter outer membrane subunit [Saccharibacter sp. 17.LH.SD]|uniref:efflux transporter outer membrane subunit n=1 Tax=Saccharibacter sp. 17.LH.SD TaxID=2689393 RepID=UPI0013715749|nr:efflux transporter outer membrane subunit [Saccharibacter sp. 17.LH.SD]MXV44848.1 efflux transporter outer membrane subunit [Saccharibacter sp. 17.LH.SD]